MKITIKDIETDHLKRSEILYPISACYSPAVENYALQCDVQDMIAEYKAMMDSLFFGKCGRQM